MELGCHKIVPLGEVALTPKADIFYFMFAALIHGGPSVQENVGVK